MYHYQLYLPPLYLKITLSMLDRKDQKITILCLFPQRLNIGISPSNCRGILILQSIKSIKFSYYHILLHLNLMQKPTNIKLLTLFFIQIPNYVKLVTETTICVRFVKLSQKPQIIFFYNCSHTRQFWTDFASYWHLL